MSTFMAISVYATLVLIGLIGVSAAFVAAAGWVVRHTDDPDAHH
jgi:hypothetical protein